MVMSKSSRSREAVGDCKYVGITHIISDAAIWSKTPHICSVTSGFSFGSKNTTTSMYLDKSPSTLNVIWQKSRVVFLTFSMFTEFKKTQIPYFLLLSLYDEPHGHSRMLNFRDAPIRIINHNHENRPIRFVTASLASLRLPVGVLWCLTLAKAIRKESEIRFVVFLIL